MSISSSTLLSFFFSSASHLSAGSIWSCTLNLYGSKNSNCKLVCKLNFHFSTLLFVSHGDVLKLASVNATTDHFKLSLGKIFCFCLVTTFRFRRKTNHLVRVWKTSSFVLKYQFWLPRKQLELSPGHLKKHTVLLTQNRRR